MRPRSAVPMGPPRGRGPRPKPEAAAAAVTDGPGDAQAAENLENLGALLSHRLVGCTPGCPFAKAQGLHFSKDQHTRRTFVLVSLSLGVRTECPRWQYSL